MIGLLSAPKQKLCVPAPAWLSYSESNRFNQQYNWLLPKCNLIYIVSFKHKIIDPNQAILPYEMSVNDMISDEWDSWRDICYGMLKAMKGPYVSLLPADYAVCLKEDIEYQAPFKGVDAIKMQKSLGPQVAQPRKLKPDEWPDDRVLNMIWKETPTAQELKKTLQFKERMDRRGAQEIVEKCLACPLHEVVGDKIVNKYAKDAI